MLGTIACAAMATEKTPHLRVCVWENHLSFAHGQSSMSKVPNSYKPDCKRTMDDSCSSLSNLNHLILYVCLSCMHACMHGKHTFTILYCLSSSTYSLPTISHIFLQCRISFPTKTKREKRRASMVKNLHWERVSS